MGNRIKIYGGFKSWTRDCRPRWAAEELGLAYDMIHLDLSKGEGKSPEFLQIHPLGKIPVVVDGDLTVFESGATVAYLAEHYGEDKIVPPKGTPERARYFQWLFFATASLESAAVKLFGNGYVFPNNPNAPAALEEGRKEFAPLAALLEKELSDKEYLLGDRFTAADILVGSTLHWVDKADELAAYPILKKYLQRLADRPAFRAAYQPTTKEFEGYPGRQSTPSA